LNVPDPGGAHGIVPSWRGVTTQKGELWKRPLSEDRTTAPLVRDYAYILGCPRGAAEINIASRTSATESELLGWLDTLEVAWR
jgi:hypothetical protein